MARRSTFFLAIGIACAALLPALLAGVAACATPDQGDDAGVDRVENTSSPTATAIVVGGKVIARVGDTAILKRDFDMYMKRAKLQAASAAGAPSFPKPGTALYDQAAAQLVDHLVTEELIRREAESRGLEVTDWEVEQAIKEFYAIYGGKTKAAQLLKQQGMTQVEFLALLRSTELDKQVRDAVVAGAETEAEKTGAWDDWLEQARLEAGVEYAPGYDPDELASGGLAPSPSGP